MFHNPTMAFALSLVLICAVVLFFIHYRNHYRTRKGGSDMAALFDDEFSLLFAEIKKCNNFGHLNTFYPRIELLKYRYGAYVEYAHLSRNIRALFTAYHEKRYMLHPGKSRIAHS